MDKEYVEKLKKMYDAALDLASYVSYAEIIGCVSHNRIAIRNSCDKVQEIHLELEKSERKINE